VLDRGIARKGVGAPKDPGPKEAAPAYRLSNIATSPRTSTTKAVPNNVISIVVMTLTLYLPNWNLCALSTPQRMIAAQGPEPRSRLGPGHSWCEVRAGPRKACQMPEHCRCQPAQSPPTLPTYQGSVANHRQDLG
jgi:hypothetical protein